MRRTPRPLTEKILTPRRTAKIVFWATIMAAGSLALLAFGPGPAPEAGVPTVAGTMAFATFILFQFFNILNARNEHRTVFRRDTFHNGKLWASLIAVVVLQVAVTHVHVLQGWFDTTDLTIGQWLVCVAVASSVLWLEELRKLAARRFLPAPSH